MTVFWDIAPCSFVEVNRRFGGTYCLHHQGDVMTSRRCIQKAVIFLLAAMRSHIELVYAEVIRERTKTDRQSESQIIYKDMTLQKIQNSTQWFSFVPT
jgi:hypothetical protein